jgi:ribonuclease J
MTLQITAVGGYNEIGRQCTAVKIGEDVVIIDLGLHLDQYIKYTADEQEDLNTTSARGLRKAGAIPDWTSIKDWKAKTRAIILTHAHLDHLGAVPYMAHLFDCPIYGSPFTIALLKQLVADKDIELKNELVIVEDKVKITDNIEAEFIRMTHSTMDARFVALHTPYGIVSIDNDYKLDHHPTLGKGPDTARLQELGGKIIAHIGECLYAPSLTRTPSESVARQMLQEVLLEEDFEGRVVLVSTFSSHIARLNTLMEIGKAMGREVVFLGRSMSKYLAAAEEAQILTVPKHVTLLKYGSQIRRFFKEKKDLSKFLIICTGHMGEQKAALNRIANGDYPFKLKPSDAVVFASRVIPVPGIIADREELQRKLRSLQVRIYDDVHVSGHASKEDIRWLLKTLKPEHLLPNHGISAMTEAFIGLAREMGFRQEQIHNLREGDRITIIE